MANNEVSHLFSVTEVELIHRNKRKASERKKVESSKDALELLTIKWVMNKIELPEQFKFIILPHKHSPDAMD